MPTEYNILVVYRISPEIQPLGQDVAKNPFNVFFARKALSDPMIFSSLLYHASVHENSRSSASLIHQGDTIRQLALRLENPSEAASDNAIGTVAFLAATGVSIKFDSIPQYQRF
jgi:hypothetical protein